MLGLQHSLHLGKHTQPGKHFVTLLYEEISNYTHKHHKDCCAVYRTLLHESIKT